MGTKEAMAFTSLPLPVQRAVLNARKSRHPQESTEFVDEPLGVLWNVERITWEDGEVEIQVRKVVYEESDYSNARG